MTRRALCSAEAHMSLSMCFIIIIDLLFLLLSLDDDYIFSTFLPLYLSVSRSLFYMSEHQKRTIDIGGTRAAATAKKWEWRGRFMILNFFPIELEVPLSSNHKHCCACTSYINTNTYIWWCGFMRFVIWGWLERDKPAVFYPPRMCVCVCVW